VDVTLEGGQLGMVWVRGALVGVEAEKRTFDEARRVLRPGGTVAFYEICAGPGGDPYFPVPWASDASLNYLETPEGLGETIVGRGFEEAAWTDVTGPSLEWFRNVVETMQSRPADAPPPLGLNLLMGAETPIKAKNVVRSLAEDRVVVIQGVFERRD
jgi:hypothetical protein